VIALGVVLGLATALLWPDYLRGWSGPEDGGLAQVAERVLHGQMPHRDFDDPWTGGWSYFQALLFGLFGTRLSIVRIPIFFAWLMGLASAYGLMRRFGSPLLSAGVALAGGLWSLYVWRFPLLGWYYFPLALLTCLCAFRYVESRRRRWLLAAGGVIGVLLLVKVTALFLLAAVMLWLMPVAAEESRGGKEGRSGFAVVVLGVVSVFVAAVYLLVRAMPAEMFGAASVHFLLPNVLLALWVWRDVSARRLGVGDGVRALLRLAAPLLAGVAMALAPFIALFAFRHQLHALFAGVAVNPGMRLTGYAFGPPGRVGTALALLAPLVLVVGGSFARTQRTRRERLLLVALGVALGALASSDSTEGTPFVLTVRAMPIVLPLFAWWWAQRSAAPAGERSQVMLLVMVAATSQLAQVPLAMIYYFLYVAPIGMLATMALFRAHLRDAPVAAFVTALLLFTRLTPALEHRLEPARQRDDVGWHTMTLPRFGLEANVLDSVRFGRMAKLVAGRPAGPIFVLGGHPEVVFLLERPNASRVIYDGLANPVAFAPRRVLRTLDSAAVRTVVIVNERGIPLETPQSTLLRRMFPGVTMIGPFELRTRDAAGAAPIPVPAAVIPR
jgi:hypothetical protein